MHAGFEAFRALVFQVQVSRLMTPCSVVVGYQRLRGPCSHHLQGEDGGNMDLRNVGTLLQQYMASQPRKTST
jgi:hypothetical protein